MELERPCPVGSSDEGFGRRGSVFPDALGMIAAEPFFGLGPRTTTRAAGGRFRAVAGRDRTERSFMRFERRYPAAAGFSLPHPRHSRTNSPSESSWTWTQAADAPPDALTDAKAAMPKIFSRGGVFAYEHVRQKPSAVRGRRISLASRRVERDGLSAGCQRRVRAVAPGSGSTCDRRETPWRYGLVIFSEEERNFKR